MYRCSVSCSVLKEHSVTLYCGLMKTYTLKESTPMKSFGFCALGRLKLFSRRQSYQDFLKTSFLVHQKIPVSVLPSLSDEPGPSTSTAAESYCYCRGPERDDMTACDSPTYSYVWFHFDCLKLSTTPRTKQWLCPECRKLPQYSREKRKTN